ncbi:serine/threonine protein kinase [Nocardiopsis sp. CNR-923]|uniref:serine/threonine-protein kinase n=1 Tax=Nocardiopsis sp. CNR-923 TaxID=1904965 RepID=UPI00095A3FEE|nr:serine/threonine-protein kinase [Nocardiopsis sp. CNR-923]OLT30107.1 serine/threonine protein kinase [Nocardiopsis sp. CNR-923]
MSARPPREISVLVPADLSPLYPTDPERIGPYLVLGRLGHGATGTVYAAVDVRAASPGDRLLAVKTLVCPELDPPEAYPALARRLRALAGVDSTRVVTPLAFDSDAEPPWVALPYVAGQRLSHYVSARGGLASGKVVALAVGLAEALSALHARGVAHGSLRPSDVVVGPHGAQVMECAVVASAERLRATAPSWTGPERARGGAATPAADVFAWGSLVAFAGTGRLPFGSGEPEEIVERAARGAFDLGGLHSGLRPIVSRALAPDPVRRPTVAEAVEAVLAVWAAECAAREETEEGGSPVSDRAELLRQLEHAWEGVEPPARVPEVVRLEGRLARHRPRRALAMAGTGALALGMIGGGGWFLFGLFGQDEEDALVSEVAEEVSPEPSEEEPLTMVVRFDPAEQEDPVEGPWVFTPVDREDEPVRGRGVPTHDEWAEQWDASGEPREAVVREDAAVLCAKFCAAPDHLFIDVEGRGTWELTGSDFIDYLSWGPVMIVEVTFAEESSEEDGPREIVAVTELFTD